VGSCELYKRETLSTGGRERFGDPVYMSQIEVSSDKARKRGRLDEVRERAEEIGQVVIVITIVDRDKA